MMEVIKEKDYNLKRFETKASSHNSIKNYLEKQALPDIATSRMSRQRQIYNPSETNPAFMETRLTNPAQFSMRFPA